MEWRRLLTGQAHRDLHQSQRLYGGGMPHERTRRRTRGCSELSLDDLVRGEVVWYQSFRIEQRASDPCLCAGCTYAHFGVKPVPSQSQSVKVASFRCKLLISGVLRSLSAKPRSGVANDGLVRRICAADDSGTWETPTSPPWQFPTLIIIPFTHHVVGRSPSDLLCSGYSIHFQP